MSDKVISSTTQEFLDVYDIVNDMVLLKDGTASMILQVGTMNFSLLAEQEQDAIIFTYGSLLNSLNYPIQISIQSQTKDVTKYLRLLDEQITKASTDRKATLIKNYRDFVAALIKERNVLQKIFFVTIPASPAEMGLFTATSVIPGKTAFDINMVEKSIILEKAANLLGPRRDHLISQFGRLGLYVRQLSTQEIIQNFYINYNPEAAEGQEISSNENYTTPLVRASFGRKIMQVNDPNVQAQPSPINPADNSRPPAPATPTEPAINNPVVANPQGIQPTPIQAAQAVAPTLESNSSPEPNQAPTVSQTEQVVYSPEEILSGENPNEERSLQENEALVTPQPTSNYIPSNEVPVAEPATHQFEVAPTATSLPEPSASIIEPITNPDLNLNLDASLLNVNPVAETNDQDLNAGIEIQPQTKLEPVAEPMPMENSAIDSTQTATPEPPVAAESAPVASPMTAPATEQNDFAEEIKPLQDKFEPEIPTDQLAQTQNQVVPDRTMEETAQI